MWMDKRDLIGYCIIAALIALPIITASGTYLFLDPATFWERIAAFLTSIGIGVITALLEVIGLKIIG